MIETIVRAGGAAAILVAALALARQPAAEAAAATISLTPAQQTVALAGGPVTVDVMVAGAENVAGFEVDIQFDPYVVEFVSATDSPFLSSSGRPVTCFSPIETTDGLVKVGCASPGEYSAPGASGDGVLTRVTFKPVGGGTTALTIAGRDLANADARDLCNDATYGSCSVANASVTVEGPVKPRPSGGSDNNTGGSGGSQGSTPGAGSTAGGQGAAQPGGTSGQPAGDPRFTQPIGGGSTAAAPSGSTRPGASGGTLGASSGAPGTGTDVGRFGTGPQPEQGSALARNAAVALALLGATLLSAGVTRGAIYGRQRERGALRAGDDHGVQKGR